MIIHIVKSGETLTGIADRYAVSVARIVSDNGIVNPDRIAVGEALVILRPKLTHIIRRGETLDFIARRYGVSAMSLLRNNPFLIGKPLPSGVEIAVTFENEKQGSLVTNGYAYPNINKLVLEYALPFLTRLTIFGYGFTSEGELIPTPDNLMLDYAKRYGVEPIMLLSTITSDETFSSVHAGIVLSSAQKRSVLVDNIIDKMKEKGYVGLDIDFEYINTELKENFADFVAYTTRRLNAEGFSVNTDLAPKTFAAQRGLLYEAHDYDRIGEASNTVLLMTYEWGYKFSEPRSTAPIYSVRDVLRYALTEIPPEKIFLGIPNYAYDRRLPYVEGSAATTIGNAYAVELAVRYGSEILFELLSYK